MTLAKSLTLSAVFGIATLGVASAQSSGLYVLHAKATATCPALDRHWRDHECRDRTRSLLA